MNSSDATAGPAAHWLRHARWARWGFAGVGACAIVGAAVYFLRPERPDPPLPVGTSRDTPQERKTAFINYVVPYVRDLNASILDDRQRLLAIRKGVAAGGQPGFFDAKWLKKIVADYECDWPERMTPSFLDQLLVRVDIVPPSLVVAQAAEESGWGTSRFAQRGNNLFGMRAYDGKGLVPKAREAGEKFKVATYKSVRESITDYVNNLNTGENYVDLRMARRELRRRGQPLTGSALAAGLSGYSGRGASYVETIRAIISANQLGRFDS